MKHLIPLFVSIGLILALVLSGCAPGEPEVVEKIVEKIVEVPGKTVEVEKVYRVLNPKGEDTPVELVGMQAPRPDTLEGLTIVCNQGEGSPVVMPTLQERMGKEFPTSTIIYIDYRAFLLRMTEEQQEACDIMIMGNTW